MRTYKQVQLVKHIVASGFSCLLLNYQRREPRRFRFAPLDVLVTAEKRSGRASTVS